MELPCDECQEQLQELIKSGYPLIFLRSSEESRAINCVLAAHQSVVKSSDIQDAELLLWSNTKGFSQFSTENSEDNVWIDLSFPSEQKPVTLEKAIKVLQQRLEAAADKPKSQHTYILPDWSAFIEHNSHSIVRQLKELVIEIEESVSDPKMTVIILGQDWSIPAIIRGCVHILDLPLPTKEELYQKFFRSAVQNKGIEDDEAQRLSALAQGMPLETASKVASLISTRNLWSEPEKAKQLLLDVKKQEIRKTGVLEYYEPQGQGLDAVGGLDELKSWIKNRQSFFQQTSQPKLRPRAILLQGYPGCGKSFISRGIAQEWGVPQINFEISRLQSKYVGESESNTYQALRAIEASAPNILFMDEIEKAFTGVGSDSTGVNTRQFGTFLSWLNDHEYPIFFIATCNDRSKLPPELFRAGRFDEIFIIMPPNKHERRVIIQKKANDYGLSSIEESTLHFLVDKTEGFSGAELEKLVKETAYLFFNPSPPQNPWEKALNQVKPQFRTPGMQTLLRNYRQLLEEGGGKLASSLEEGEEKSASSEKPGFLDRLIQAK